LDESFTTLRISSCQASGKASVEKNLLVESKARRFFCGSAPAFIKRESCLSMTEKDPPLAICIRDGLVVDPRKDEVVRRDLLIEAGTIRAMLPRKAYLESGPRLRIIDASGKLILPGLIDIHVHLREPGDENKETIATGSKAGVAGGFTGLACMPNTKPVNDSPSVTRFILRKAQDSNLLRIFPIAAITKGQAGETLTDFADLRRAGAVGVSDDGFPVMSRELMRRAMEYGRANNLPVISHCEDLNLSSGGVMHEGFVSARLGLRGIPAASEEKMVEREISLARETGCSVHIAHVSTAGSVDLIRRAKEEGLSVTAETAPHYFCLDHTAVMRYNTDAKMNPPLRGPEDVQAVRKGLKDDVIDAIATDHAPHSAVEKKVIFEKAPFGIIGLETALPLTLALVREGILTLAGVARKLSRNPAKILGLKGGFLEEGAPADLAIIDSELEYVLRAEELQSKSKNSPFLGVPMKGRNVITIMGGRVVWERDANYLGS
jgi:dihydroorotase